MTLPRANQGLDLLPINNIRQTGVSLVQILMASSLGSVITLGICSLFISSKTMYLTQSENAILHDTATTAMTNMARSIRQADFIVHDDWNNRNVSLAITKIPLEPGITGLDGKSLNPVSPGITAPIASTVNGSDILAIRFSGSSASGNSATHQSDQTMHNCGGFGLSAPQHPDNAENERGWSIYYVAPGASGEPELFCKYAGKQRWAATAIARGVESFQVLYGLEDRHELPNRQGPQNSADPAIAAPLRLNATQIHALDAALQLTGATPEERRKELRQRSYWNKVTSVSIALLLRSKVQAQSHPVGDTDQPQQKQRHDLFGAEYALAQGATDKGTSIDIESLRRRHGSRLWRSFGTTIHRQNIGTRPLPPQPQATVRHDEHH